MRSRSRPFIVWPALFVLAALIGAGVSYASNRWGCWKYANYYIRWYNGGTGDYWNIYNEETKTDSRSWHRWTDVYLPGVSGPGTTDHINAFNGWYGSTGWLGIAEIRRYSGCTIQEGRTRLNMSYLENGYSRTNKKHVACQEVGHLLGLHHTTASDTCMNDRILNNPWANFHDRDMVNALY